MSGREWVDFTVYIVCQYRMSTKQRGFKYRRLTQHKDLAHTLGKPECGTPAERTNPERILEPRRVPSSSGHLSSDSTRRSTGLLTETDHACAIAVCYDMSVAAATSLGHHGNSKKGSALSSELNREPNVGLFSRNLRLLGLDEYEDWPEISGQSFSIKDTQQNQKKRVQCTEWALYRLFQLWDEALAADVSRSSSRVYID
jgi:hypothetical protein